MGCPKSRKGPLVTIKRLSLSHFDGEADEVKQLATQLRLRGIVPWVDKAGGFEIGDHSPSKARHAIREDCFGLLLYATEAAFTREFIRDVEIDEARKAHQAQPDYLLLAVPRGMGFDDLKEQSVRAFGFDLSPFHTLALPCGCDLTASFSKVATMVLDKTLRRALALGEHTSLSLQFSTRDLLPDEAEDVLRIDATRLADLPELGQPGEQLLAALRDVKSKVAEILGRPRLRVNGSKHLSAAFMFGRVFAPFCIDIRQTAKDVWRTDAECPMLDLLAVSRQGGEGQRCLFIEVASRNKNVTAGVDEFVERTGVRPSMRLQLRPPAGPLDLDNALCLAMVRQVYGEIERAMQHQAADNVHVFAAVPQAFMIMLGREFKGMPLTYVYDWNGTQYELGCRVLGGVL
jgi:hypothetical protein